MDAVDLDVETLFNDGQLDNILPAGNGLQPTALPVPGLAEQFLNLRFSGGFNRASWSRQGHIAIISDDGSSVSVQWLRAVVESGEWKLSAPRILDATFENAVSIVWSPTGFDLAIVDSRGRVGVHSMTPICLNRLNESKSALTDDADELGMMIGSCWLNHDKQDRAKPVAIRRDEKWVHQMTKVRARGPLYPRAFFMVSRRGVLSLTYQRPGARYARTSLQLPCLSEAVCSHAAFAPTTEGKILLAVYSTGSNLTVYQITLDFEPVISHPASNNQPDLTVETISTCVSMWVDVDASKGGPVAAYRPDEWALIHMTILPTSDMDGTVHEAPSIWAAFTLTGAGTDTNNDGFLQSSVIRRWSVQSQTRVLHSRFDDIPTKVESSMDNERVFFVDRLVDIELSQPVLAIELVDNGQAVAISTSDGRTEFWNPATQAFMSYEGQPNEIMSLPQFGLVFPPAVNAISTVLSPNACSILSVSEDSKPSLHYLQCSARSTTQDLDLADQQQFSGAAMTFALSRSCSSNTNGDDVLACIIANYDPNQYGSLLSEMYRTLFEDVCFIHERAPGSEVDRLVSKPLVTKVLSLQMALLGRPCFSVTSTDEAHRYGALGSVWAWIATNLRYIATTFYIFYREYRERAMAAQQNTNLASIPPLAPSYTEAICNTIHWVLDLFRFMFTTILEIGDRQTNPDFFTPPTFANNMGDEKGDGTQGLVALILNCQWTRSFLIAIFRAMRAFIETNERNSDRHISLVVRTIHRYSSGKGMSITAIDKLLDSRWYALNGLREGEQMNNATIAKRQMAMYSTGRVGPEYANTLRDFLEKIINEPDTGLRATGELQRLKLWTETPDLNWLLLGFNPQFYTRLQATSTSTYALTNDASAGPAVSPKLYDVHRRSEFVVTGAPDQLVRRCIRCGSISGDVAGIDKTWSKTMAQYLAKCVCDAYWLIEPVQGEADPQRK